MSQLKNVYQDVTDTIIKNLEKGVIPWRKTWKSTGLDVLPSNLLTKKNYRGINLLLLWCEALIKEYSCGSWLTFRQCKTLGGHIKKGEKSTRIIFWNWDKKKELLNQDTQDLEDWTAEEINQGYRMHKHPFARYYSVFNLDQVEDLSADKLPVIEVKDHQPLEEAENIIKNYSTIPAIEPGNPAYSPSLDKIYMPDISKFESPEEFHCTLFHECIHSTGHHSRLNREGIEDPSVFGSETYSFEELVAEIGASFLNAEAGISDPVIENSSAYIQGWLKKLKNDKNFIVQAAGKAQKAADFILG